MSTVFCIWVEDFRSLVQLRELIKEIRRRKGLTQAQLAAELGINQQNVQGMENSGRTLEKQFATFLKLLPVCVELGLLDPEQNLSRDPTIDLAVNPTKEDWRRGLKKIDSQTPGEDERKTPAKVSKIKNRVGRY